MARGNNNLLLIAVVGLLIVLGVVYVRGNGQKSKGQTKSGANEAYASSGKIRNHTGRDSDGSDPVFLAQADGDALDLVSHGDDFQLLGVADEEPAFRIGFGMGPGLYGSDGRYTSEMVGN